MHTLPVYLTMGTCRTDGTPRFVCVSAHTRKEAHRTAAQLISDVIVLCCLLPAIVRRSTS